MARGRVNIDLNRLFKREDVDTKTKRELTLKVLQLAEKNPGLIQSVDELNSTVDSLLKTGNLPTGFGGQNGSGELKDLGDFPVTREKLGIRETELGKEPEKTFRLNKDSGLISEVNVPGLTKESRILEFNPPEPAGSSSEARKKAANKEKGLAILKARRIITKSGKSFELDSREKARAFLATELGLDVDKDADLNREFLKLPQEETGKIGKFFRRAGELGGEITGGATQAIKGFSEKFAGSAAAAVTPGKHPEFDSLEEAEASAFPDETVVNIAGHGLAIIKR